MTTESYKDILSEMETALNEFTNNSPQDAYTYEKRFREITDTYNQHLFQSSMGEISVSKNDKNTLQTGFGKVEIKKRCVMSNFLMGFKISPYSQEQICRMGSKLPFEEAAEMLSSMLSVEINAKQAERLCHCYGEELEKLDWTEAYSDGIQTKITTDKSSVTYCMADGSMLLTREDKWKEVKVGRVFSSDSRIEEISKGRGHISDSVYSAHFGNSADFWERFSKEIPERKQLVFICDGGKWLWKYISDCYPDSIQILDYFHCKEHLYEFAKEFYRDAAQSSKFVDDVFKCLNNKSVENGLKKIRELKITSKTVQNKRDKLLHYLESNRERINYGLFLEKGLLIGSGAIEAAHRNIIQKRLKLSGQRWTIKGAQQIINLRVYDKSKRWDKVLDIIKNQNNAA